jgi:hypothetical protein
LSLEFADTIDLARMVEGVRISEVVRPIKDDAPLSRVVSLPRLGYIPPMHLVGLQVPQARHLTRR